MSSEEIPGHLPRGRACQACRVRKMKCDGNLPICNQCARFNRQHECVFVPGPAPSNTRMLEHEIDRLQARIGELELRDRATGASSSSLNFPSKWWEPSEPPRRVSQALVQYFAPHASKFGFFLDFHRFTDTLARQSSSSSSSGPRIPTVLRAAVHLWGIHLSRHPEIMAHEGVFLDRAVRAVQAALSAISQRPGTTLHVIQSEILLAYYFFDCNRPLEGQHHTSGAVSLAFTCKLHKIEPGRPTAGSILPPAADATEETERIHAWWQVFTLEKSWTAALDSPSAITEDRGSDYVVDTPWPRDRGGQYVYGRTVKNFLANVNGDRSNSLLAIHGKAAALYERAAYIASLRSRNTPDVASTVAALDASIENFKRLLPSLGSGATAPASVRHDLLVIHSLVQCATIALHRGFVRQSNTARTRCLDAAHAIVCALQTINSQDLGYVDPILAVTCSNAHDILFSALRSSRSSRSGSPGEEVVVFGMDILKKIFSLFAANSALFVNHLTKLREAQASLH